MTDNDISKAMRDTADAVMTMHTTPANSPEWTAARDRLAYFHARDLYNALIEVRHRRRVGDHHSGEQIERGVEQGNHHR